MSTTKDLLREYRTLLRMNYPVRQRGRLSVTALLDGDAPVPTVTFDWPAEAEHVRATYWTIGQASRAWGVPYGSVRRWLYNNLQHAVMLALLRPDGTTVTKLAMRAGQDRTFPPAGRPGNPRFHDCEYQQQLAMRRWKRPHLAPDTASADDPPWDD